MDEVIIGIIIIAVILAVGVYMFKVQFPRSQARRRAENKVRMSDIILRSDIEALEQTNSRMVEDAIALRRSQIQSGRHPDAQRPV